MPNRASILLIDDSPGECELFRLALNRTGFDIVLYIEQDTEAALHLLQDQSGLPSLIVLDWHLRNQHGDEFLRIRKADVRLASIPVVVFTTSDNASDLASAYANGANGYVVKPATFDELVRWVGDICSYWLNLNQTPYLVGASC